MGFISSLYIHFTTMSKWTTRNEHLAFVPLPCGFPSCFSILNEFHTYTLSLR